MPRAAIATLVMAVCLPGCVHTQKPVRFDGPAALALEVLARELEALGVETADMDEPAGVLETRWQDTGFLYGFVGEQEATLFRRYVVVLQRRPADTGLTLRADVRACPRSAGHTTGRLPAACKPVDGLVDSHQQELKRLGAELQRALARLRPSPEASAGIQLAVAVPDLRAPPDLLGPAEKVQLSGYLASRLTETGRFRVVPRAELEAAIARTQRDSYSQSHSAESQIELGRAVAARKLLSVQLLRAGGACKLSGTIFDLTEAAAEAAASVDTGCGPDALPAGIDALVRALVDRLPNR
ncbi:MAG: hypothetical protein JXR96_25585 [Deltaproteobacteria bacterium]|nr:hypothetical protein [Deltaproteobacteria bacterium]